MATARARDLNVLIIDDQEAMRRLHRFSLRQIGITQVEEAASGLAALGYLRVTKYSFVICDWNMQPMDGLQLFKTMQADPDMKKIPFIMVTGNIQETDIKTAIGAGVRYYLGKPYTVQALKLRIEKAVGKLV